MATKAPTLRDLHYTSLEFKIHNQNWCHTEIWLTYLFPLKNLNHQNVRLHTSQRSVPARKPVSDSRTTSSRNNTKDRQIYLLDFGRKTKVDNNNKIATNINTAAQDRQLSADPNDDDDDEYYQLQLSTTLTDPIQGQNTRREGESY